MLLWNTYQGRGGFLETNGNGTVGGARFEVDSNPYFNRAADVTLWKIQRA
ncbi:hypothetical protein [Streptomyces sp. NPDC006368]